MEYNKLKAEVEATVKRLADGYFEDIMHNPKEYAENFNTSDEDVCWDEAIEYAKQDVRSEPKTWIDEDFQEEMEEQDWYHVWEITEGISWRTYNNLEIERCFKEA